MLNSAYDLAYYSFQEIILDAQIQISGANLSYFLEKYDRKRKSMKKQILVTKIVYAFLFSVMPLIPIITYFQTSQRFIEGIFPINVVIFIESLLFTMYFLLQFVYFLSLRMLNFGIIMSGDAFRYFETLPLSRKKLYRIVFYTIFRSLDIPVISMLIIFPITIGVFTSLNYGLLLGIVVGFLCTITSAFNLLLSFSILIILGKKINFALNLNALNNKKSNMIRVLTMFSYIFLIFGTSFLIQWVFREIGTFLTELTHFQYSFNLNLVLSLIPYPFSMSYILSFVLIDREIPELLRVTSIAGFVIMIFLIIVLMLYAIKSLKNVYSTPSFKVNNLLETSSSEYKNKIKISSKKPLKAFVYKDLLSSSRNLESFMNLIMPFVITIVYTFSYFANASIGEGPIIIFYVIYIFVVLGFNPLISSILIVGLTNIEESGSTILSSLPIKPGQQAKGKLITMLVASTLAILAPLLLYITSQDFLLLFLLVIITLPINWIMLVSMFLLKVYYFGRRKFKYVLEEISPDKKVLKWFVIFIFEYVFFFFFMISTASLLFLNEIPALIFSLIAFITGGAIFCYVGFIKMFPKHKNLKTETITLFINRSLDKRLWLKILVVMSLFALVSLFFYYFPKPEYRDYWSYYSYPIILGILEFGSMSLLFFIVYPKLLGYSKSTQNFEEYFTLVKMKWLKANIKPIFIGVICGVIFSIVCLILSFQFEFYIMFLYDIRLFFIIANIFWEEMLLRGIVLGLLEKKSFKVITILINSLLSVALYVGMTFFSYYNALESIYNAENYFFMYNYAIIVIFLASAFSSYIVLKTDNLLPAIIIGVFVFIPLWISPFLSIPYIYW